MKILFVHEWGTDPGIWHPVCESLSEQQIYILDLGFLRRQSQGSVGPVKHMPLEVGNDASRHWINQPFGTNHRIPVPGPYLGIGHSLGVAWLLRYASNSLTGLISIAGFSSFANPRTIPGLEKMKKGLTKNPAVQMKSFWKSANIRLDLLAGINQGPSSEIEHILDLDKLNAGLDYLSEGDESSTLECLSCPVRALASRDDKIVPETMTRSQWTENQLRWANSGGHGLPISQVDWCVDQINLFIAELSEG